MIINSYCKNYGWLGEDFQSYFRNAGLRTSEAPDENAGAWICLRTDECRLTPDISRTIVQVHDMYDHDIRYIQRAALVVFTHPMQSWLWEKKGFLGNGTVLPIGARRGIRRSESCPERPTIGFFCGETPLMEKRSNLFHDVVVAARKRLQFDVLMIGRNLHPIAELGVWYDRAAGLDDYQHIDTLFTASVSPAIPLSVYEACSIGIPIISTPRWFPYADWPNVYFGNDEAHLRDCVFTILSNRVEFFDKREKMKFSPFYLEDWIRYQVNYFRDMPDRISRGMSRFKFGRRLVGSRCARLQRWKKKLSGQRWLDLHPGNWAV